MKKIKLNSTIKVLIIYDVLFVLISAILCNLIPILLNYPPNSINNDFERTIDDGYLFWTQTTMIVFIVTLLSNVYIICRISHLKKYKQYINKDDEKSKKKLAKIIKQCFSLSTEFYFVHLIIPTMLVAMILLFTGVHQRTMILRILLFVLTEVATLGMLTQTLGNSIRMDILSDLKNDRKQSAKIKSKYSVGLVITMLPLLIFVVVVLTMTNIMQLAKEKGEFLTIDYKNQIESQMHYCDKTLEEAILKLKEIDKYDQEDTLFVISREGVVYQDNDVSISDFFIKYTFNVAKDGHTYGYYATWIEGAYEMVEIDGVEYAVGIMYATSASSDYMLYLMLTTAIVAIVAISFASVFANNKSQLMVDISEKITLVATRDNINYDDKIAVLSNDEVGDIAVAYNKILDIQKQHDDELEKNKEMLIESERLLSLGQLIGGMAHNLKTPIMSIAGACKALEDLTQEYHDSITSDQVTVQDHYEIAKDMNEWIEKIKNYNAYMTDVINATKGQAVSMNASTVDEFTIEEVVARVNVLMKEQLLQRGCTLNYTQEADSNTTVKGEVSAIVQVIDNLIVNAMDAYNGKQGEIGLDISEDNKKVYIKVSDHAGGIPDNVKEKLFKQMITTKGKEGTGLGLYMCYSTIKGKFNGDMKFKTEKDQGTTFFIELNKK